jgi:hypothetical protein
LIAAVAVFIIIIAVAAVDFSVVFGGGCPQAFFLPDRPEEQPSAVEEVPSPGPDVLSTADLECRPSQDCRGQEPWSVGEIVRLTSIRYVVRSPVTALCSNPTWLGDTRKGSKG